MKGQKRRFHYGARGGRDFRRPHHRRHFASAVIQLNKALEAPNRWSLVEMRGRGRRLNGGPHRISATKKLSDGAWETGTGAGPRAAISEAVSSPSATVRPRPRRPFVTSPRCRTEVSARPLTRPPHHHLTTPNTVPRVRASYSPGLLSSGKVSPEREVLWFIRTQQVQCRVDKNHFYLKFPCGSGW